MLTDNLVGILLASSAQIRNRKKAWIGFDGFIDELFKVIETRHDESHCTYFPTIARFSEHIANAAGKSADLELVSIETKLGGNAPIMAHALAKLGIDTTCIGALGYPKLHPAFSPMSQTCRCISLCNPACTYAYEFRDGKLMFANLNELNKLDWPYLKSELGIQTIVEMAIDSDLWGLVNWSVMSGADSIWKGFYHEVLPLIPTEVQKEKTIFIDLADPAKREKKDILSILDLVRRFGKTVHTILGLNENEALRVHSVLWPDCSDLRRTLAEKVQAIYDYLQIDAVIVHPTDRCLIASGDAVKVAQGTLVDRPVITTGGGDNFNAGFCMAYLLGLSFEECARTAMAVSGFYVRNGYSPSFEELVAYMKAGFQHVPCHS